MSVSGIDEGRIVVTEGMTLNELATEIQNYLRNDAGIDFVAVNVTANGEIVIDTSVSENVNGLQIHSSRPVPTLTLQMPLLSSVY